MRASNGLSRRDMMRLVGAAGLAMTGGHTSAFAQAAGRIESTAPELANIIDTSEPIRQLATGFGGDIGPAEGPLWISDGRYLLFNDIQTARRMKYTPGASGASVAMEKTNEANGITRDLQGRIISAEHLTRRVTRYEPDGSITVVANSFQGKRLLRPNDVIVKSDGTIYFTDPGGTAAPEQWDVTLSGVYRVSGDLGSMSLVVDDMVRPNGLALSPDERRSLCCRFTAPSRARVRSSAQRHGRHGTSRVFVDLNGAEPGVPTESRSTPRAISTAAAQAASTSWTPKAGNWGGSSTGSRRRRISRSAATIGRRSTSPPGARSSSVNRERSPGSRCRRRRGRRTRRHRLHPSGAPCSVRRCVFGPMAVG